MAVVGRRRDKLEETLAGHDPDRVLALSADIAEPAEAAGVVDAVVERFGGLDVSSTTRPATCNSRSWR